jgi:hypothetical protein
MFMFLKIHLSRKPQTFSKKCSIYTQSIYYIILNHRLNNYDFITFFIIRFSIEIFILHREGTSDISEDIRMKSDG